MSHAINRITDRFDDLLLRSQCLAANWAAVKFKVFQQDDGLWYWELHTEDGSVVATTSSGSVDLNTALTVIAKVKRGMQTAQTLESPDSDLPEPVATVI